MRTQDKKYKGLVISADGAFRGGRLITPLSASGGLFILAKGGLTTILVDGRTISSSPKKEP